MKKKTRKTIDVPVSPVVGSTPHAPSLLNYGLKPKPFYIAVCKYSYGVNRIAAMAIRLAQTEVPAKAEPSQLLVYRSDDFTEPMDFKAGAPVWPNGDQPRLCGLTNTHEGFRQKLRI